MYYRPGNAYLVLAGDFETEQAMRWLEQYFGSIPAGEGEVPRVTIREPEHDEERRIERRKAVPLPAYIAGYYIPHDGHPGFLSLDSGLEHPVGRPQLRVYQSLVYEKQLALQADAFSSVREHPNLFMAILIMNQGASTRRRRSCPGRGIPEDDDGAGNRCRTRESENQIRSSYIMGRQTVRDKATALVTPPHPSGHRDPLWESSGCS